MPYFLLLYEYSGRLDNFCPCTGNTYGKWTSFCFRSFLSPPADLLHQFQVRVKR
jgi:hypothetical protein